MQDRDYHMSQELTMPLSPLHPSVFFASFFLFVYRCTDMCASQHSGAYEACLCLEGGTPVDIKNWLMVVSPVPLPANILIG